MCIEEVEESLLPVQNLTNLDSAEVPELLSRNCSPLSDPPGQASQDLVLTNMTAVSMSASSSC